MFILPKTEQWFVVIVDSETDEGEKRKMSEEENEEGFDLNEDGEEDE